MTQISPFLATAYVAIGGAIGAAARYQAGRAITHMLPAPGGFPWATLSVNVVGSLAMGLLFGWLAREGGSSDSLRLLLGVGLLGGFTTFSAFSLEMLLLIERGQAGLAVVYAAISVLAGLAALFIGVLAMRGAAA